MIGNNAREAISARSARHRESFRYPGQRIGAAAGAAPELIDHRLFAFAVAAVSTAVRTWKVLSARREAGIALTRHGRGFGIDLVEIFENGRDGAAHV